MAGQTLEQKSPYRLIRLSAAQTSSFSLPSPDERIFSLLLLQTGYLEAEVRWTPCLIKAPAAVCLNERKNFRVLQEHHTFYEVLYFDPSFIHEQMTISALRHELSAEQLNCLGFFPLSPFLDESPDKLYLSLSDEVSETIHSYFSSLQRELERQENRRWPCHVRACFMDILDILERIYHRYSVQKMTSLRPTQMDSGELRCILAYIHSHLEEEITLDELCDQFRMSRNRAENLFRKYTGHTFYAYIRAQKLERVCRYLRFTELRAGEIAARAGFSSSQNLCKFFKAMTGTTPRAYRLEEMDKRSRFLQAAESFAGKDCQDKTVPRS